MKRDTERHVDDPRNNPNHRERRPVQHAYTVAHVAALAGVSIQTVRAAASRHGSAPAELNMRSLESVVRFVVKRVPWAALVEPGAPPAKRSRRREPPTP